MPIIQYKVDQKEWVPRLEDNRLQSLEARIGVVTKKFVVLIENVINPVVINF